MERIWIIHWTVGLMKRTLYKNESVLSQPYIDFGGNINVKVDLSNYATKSDIKNILHVDTWSFSLKTNLANLKTEVDKLDIDKLVPVPVVLIELSDVAKNDVVRKTVYDKLVEKVNKIDTGGFVSGTKYAKLKKKSWYKYFCLQSKLQSQN